ncbi:hypothetical protein CPC16_007154 [Podila verticillata]|nr:hypothetical protein CPC16_007154 [Podila verticillata]
MKHVIGEGEDEEDEDEDDSNGEDDSNDEDDENDDEEDDQGVEGGSGKAIHGKSIDTKSPPRMIPVASTAVAVWKRERVRAAWVDSVFGTTGGSDNSDNRTNSQSSFQWQHGEQAFSYDGQSDVIDRRMSSIGPMRGREDSFSRSIRASVLKPAPALSSVVASSPNYNQMTFSHRLQPVSPMHEHYAEFFDDDDFAAPSGFL